jgi:bifunctional UDP-N-acetylglucosamine pyrophosphorylase/glucosamine-1-phosphate N-acetyltransferase
MSSAVNEFMPVAAVVVLAAGAGTRMKSKRSKLLHTIGGKTLLSLSLNAVEDLEPERLVVVVGHEREQVNAHLAEIAPGALSVVQEEQRGTGHAVQCALSALEELTSGEVVVTYADVPLLSSETLLALSAQHRAEGNAVTILTAISPDPSGYGRIVRDGEQVARIVEHKDATEAEREIAEINSGIYIFDFETLRAGLASLNTNNSQGELYLTDVISFARANGKRVGAYLSDDFWQTEGVNDRVQLATLGAEYNRRIVTNWMREGVTVVDPATTWVDADVDLAPDVTLLPGVQLHGATSVEAGATIGPDTTIFDSEIGAGTTITRSHIEFALVGANVKIGPYARLRPGTEIGDDSKIGSFVETKNTQLAAGTLIERLSYVGGQN